MGVVVFVGGCLLNGAGAFLGCWSQDGRDREFWGVVAAIMVVIGMLVSAAGLVMCAASGKPIVR